MRPIIGVVLPGAVLLPCCLTPLASQSLDSLCTAIRTIAVGDWAEYRMTGGGAGGVIRNQIVGTTARGDTTFWWHETVAQADRGALVIRSLVPGYPFEPRQVRALFMRMGEEPPVEMPPDMLALMQAGEGPEPANFTSREACGRSGVVGWETAETPAGPIRALHVRPAGEAGEPIDLWLSLDVPFGLVRLTGADLELLLLAYGTDAQSAMP